MVMNNDDDDDDDDIIIIIMLSRFQYHKDGNKRPNVIIQLFSWCMIVFIGVNNENSL